MRKAITFMLFCIITLYFGSVYALSTTATAACPIPNNAIIAKCFAPPCFNGIQVNGPFRLQIVQKPGKPSVSIIGPADELSHVFIGTHNGMLYLQADKKVQHAILVKMSVNQLNQIYMNSPYNTVITGRYFDLRLLVVSNTGDVAICGLKSRALNIQDTGSGHIRLRGTIVLQNIDYSGNGKLTIQWVDSNYVNVNGKGNGEIFLAGVVSLLNVTLSEQTHLNARYLHANRAFINTRDQSRADVWASDALNTLSTGCSNIYYYHDPAFLGQYMRPPGNTLRMTNIHCC
jgi:hypothetical protein